MTFLHILSLRNSRDYSAPRGHTEAGSGEPVSLTVPGNLTT